MEFGWQNTSWLVEWNANWLRLLEEQVGWWNGWLEELKLVGRMEAFNFVH